MMDEKGKNSKVKKALKKLKRTALRQEHVKFNKLYYVNEELKDTLLSPNWQIFFGRRGTGKTTTLKALKDCVNNHRKGSGKSIAVYIDLSQCTPSDFGVAVTDIGSQRIMIYRYFHDFIKKLCEEILELYINKQSKSFITKISKRYPNKDKIETLVLDIAEITDNGYFHRQPDTETISTKQTKDSESKIGTKLSHENMLPSLTVKGGIDNKTSDEVIQTQSFVFREASKYKLISKKLSELRKLLELENIYILIDEWTSLDKCGKYEIQPLFAELLNRTFRQLDGVSVKIASIKGTTTLYRSDTQSRLGLQLGEDIYEAGDLDELHSNNNDNNWFFECLIFKKLVQLQDNILEFSTVDSNGNYLYEPQKGFIRSFFQSPKLFDELVEASGRIPRLFIEFFSSVSKSFSFKITPRWNRSKIMDEIINVSIIKEQELLNNEKLGMFYEKLINLVKDTNQRIFLLPHKEMTLFAEVISELFHYKFIHNVNRKYLPIEIDKKYRAYYIDYGIYLNKTKKHEKANYSLSKENFEYDYLIDSSQYVLHSTDINLNFGICNNCNRAISLSHNAVVNLSACYHCYQLLKLA